MEQSKTMAQIPLMQLCKVEEIQGADTLRLMDLGFFPGSSVMPYYRCMHGGTRIYRVKGTLIALRDRDAEQIQARVVD